MYRDKSVMRPVARSRNIPVAAKGAANYGAVRGDRERGRAVAELEDSVQVTQRPWEVHERA